MSDLNEISSKRVVVFISGAGQGFGRACALSAAKMFSSTLTLIICGRHLDSLNETSKMIKEINPLASVKIFTLDLLKVNEHELIGVLNGILDKEGDLFDYFIIIHNAASLGDVALFSYDFVDEEYLSAFFKVNVTGTIILNNVLLRRVSDIIGDSGASIIVVNVSSLAAIKPFASMSIYCTAKAAREMFFSCLSLEWKSHHSQSLWVINYAPGPMDTDMFRSLCENSSDDATKAYACNIVKSKEILTTGFSSDKLFKDVIGRHGHIESGSRRDVYDI